MLKKLIIIAALALTLIPRPALGQGGAKHAAVAALVSGSLTQLCKSNIKPSDGSSNAYGCFLMGVIPTIVGASLFEAIQNDTLDAGNDIKHSAIGAIGASILVISIDF